MTRQPPVLIDILPSARSQVVISPPWNASLLVSISFHFACTHIFCLCIWTISEMDARVRKHAGSRCASEQRKFHTVTRPFEACSEASPAPPRAPALDDILSPSLAYISNMQIHRYWRSATSPCLTDPETATQRSSQSEGL